MYPVDCRGSASGIVRLYKGSTRLGQTSFSGSNGFGYVNKVLEPGTYKM